jgi:uncharacterized membrane protein
MSWASLHAVVNHFPIVLTVVGAIALLLAMLHERRAVWIYALTSLTLAGATIYPASATGDRAADMVRRAWYIAPNSIRTHTAAADITVWIVGVTGVLALIALITLARTREATSPARGFRILVGLGALASICAVGYTGYLGGKIVIESPILQSPVPPVLLPTSPANNTVPAPTGQTTQPAIPAPTQQAAPSPQSPIPQPAVPQTQTQVPAPARP